MRNGESREGEPGGFQTGGFPTFLGKAPDCVADPSETVPRRHCYWVAKRKRTNPENLQTISRQVGKIPENSGKDKKLGPKNGQKKGKKRTKKGKRKTKNGPKKEREIPEKVRVDGVRGIFPFSIFLFSVKVQVLLQSNRAFKFSQGNF